MRSACEFFMSPEDETEFIEWAAASHGVAFNGKDYAAELTCSFGSIQFLRSQRFGFVLTAGRFSCTTTGLNGELLSAQSTAANLEKVYRSLRRWLQKRYTNDLVAYNEAFPPEERKTVRYPSFWLGPFARNWLCMESHAVLRQFHHGKVVFMPDPNPSKERLA